ncbi:UBA [Musa troglodytarum]|uniref:UBA n=1 Tax=Musa troglodytarum TaxID=320322 RepID=A0A9E7KBD4_9LILI|nr:UBA [Musa troglodytarum]
MGMGYKENAAKRALRMIGQDVRPQVHFLVEEQAWKILRKQENIQRQAEILYSFILCHRMFLSYFLINDCC